MTENESDPPRRGWFGERWGGGICDDQPHLETPVGRPCDYWRCGEPIEADDCGVAMPHIRAGRTVETVYVHLDCQLRSVGIPPCPDPGGPGCTCGDYKHVRGYPHVR